MPGRCEEHRSVSVELLKPLEQIFGLLCDSLAGTIIERMAGLLPDFESLGKKTSYELEAIRDQMGTLAASTELLENANRTNKLLGAQFYDERIIGPMVRGLFPIVDLVRDALRQPDSDRQCLCGLRAQLEQFLTGYGIEAFSHEASSPFDPKTMKPLQTAATHEPDSDGLVAESLQCGFRNPERILRLETVSLYKFEAPSTTPLVHIERSSK